MTIPTINQLLRVPNIPPAPHPLALEVYRVLVQLDWHGVSLADIFAVSMGVADWVGSSALTAEEMEDIREELGMGK